MDAVKKEIERPPHAKSVLFDTRELAGWDSSMVWFLSKASELCRESGIAVDRGRLPKGLRRLVELAEAVPEKKGARRESVAMPFLKRVGNSAIGAISSLTETLNFLGEMAFTFLKLVKVRFRAVDLFRPISGKP
jgi:phospholipid/cholesterol/gamma-HCH transport system permease protein